MKLNYKEDKGGIMDKEAQEKIKAILRHYFREQLGLAAAIDIADEILEAIGYRKLPKKPLLLTAKEVTEIMKDCWTNSIPLGKTDLEKYANLSRALCFEVIEAQRESDIKWYEQQALLPR